MTATVPTLDFSLYSHGTAADQARFCEDLKQVFAEFGFAKLTNHLISKDDVREVFAWNKRFFHLPLELKMKAAHAKQPNPHRGYSYLGQEMLSRVKDFEKGILNESSLRDVKESYDQGPKDDKMYPNVWPAEEDIPGFRNFLTKFYDDCHSMHLTLLEALARSFGLASSFFRDRCAENTSELRLNYYPPVSWADLSQGAKRISEHSDFGTITLLFQDTVGGLEFERQDGTGEYVPIEVGEQTDLILNIGDCLQRWTNEQLRSASHRVVGPTAPPGVDPSVKVPGRCSVAYFGKPNRDMSVATSPEFVRAGTEAKYTKPMTAWEYNQSKLLRTY